MLSAICFYLDQSKILSSGNGSSFSQTGPGFYVFASLLKTLREKEKLLVTVFSTCLETSLPFSTNLKLFSANSFSFEETKICCLPCHHERRLFASLRRMVQCKSSLTDGSIKSIFLAVAGIRRWADFYAPALMKDRGILFYCLSLHLSVCQFVTSLTCKLNFSLFYLRYLNYKVEGTSH